VETSEGPDVVIARQLLDQAKLFGFTFQRAVPGIDPARWWATESARTGSI
jgi:hypothetical protein